MCADRELTKDVIQSLFLELWEKRAQLGEITYWNAYLKKSLHRKLLGELKKPNHHLKAIHTSTQEPSTPSYEELLINFQMEEDKRCDLKEAIQLLSEQEKTMLRLRFNEGMNYEEIAKDTGKSKQTIYNQIFSAIKKLRKTLTIALII